MTNEVIPVTLPDAEKPKPLLAKAEAIKQMALAYRVTDAQTAIIAGEMVQQIVGQRKDIQDYWKPKKQAMDAAKKVILDAEKEMLSMVEEPETHLREELKKYDQEQERKEQEAKRIAEEEARRQAEEERERLLELQEEDGASAEEIAAMAAMPLMVPPVIPQFQRQKIKGLSVPKTWKGECTNILALVQFVAKNPTHVGLIQANDQGINGMAKSTGGAVSIPGIRFFQVSSTSVRRK